MCTIPYPVVRTPLVSMTDMASAFIVYASIAL